MVAVGPLSLLYGCSGQNQGKYSMKAGQTLMVADDSSYPDPSNPVLVSPHALPSTAQKVEVKTHVKAIQDKSPISVVGNKPKNETVTTQLTEVEPPVVV